MVLGHPNCVIHRTPCRCKHWHTDHGKKLRRRSSLYSKNFRKKMPLYLQEYQFHFANKLFGTFGTKRKTMSRSIYKFQKQETSSFNSLKASEIKSINSLISECGNNF